MADAPENEQREEKEGGLDRRQVIKYGGTGALGAGLAGCQTQENPLPGSNIRSREGGGLGEGFTDDQGQGPLKGEVLKIGVLAPMNLPLGQSIWDAARMARDSLNQNGGVLGAKVEVELGDTEVSPGKSQSEHRRLTSREGCHMTTGIFLGSALLQTMPSIANQEKIHVTTASADPRIGKLVSRSQAYQSGADPAQEYEKYKYHFRAGPIHLLDLADGMLEFIEDKKEDYGWDRVAVLTENLGEFTPYHDRLIATISDIVDVPITQRPGGVSDWSPLFNEIENAGCDAAIIGMALGGTTAVNQWAQQQRQFEFGGIHVFAQSFGYWESTDGNVEHVFTMNAMTPQTENTPQTQPFVQSYIDRWDRVPIYSGALTWDALTTINQLFELMNQDGAIDDTIPHADDIIPYLEEMRATNLTILEESQFTPPDAEYAHEPQWTSIAETGVPVFQQWQQDPDVRENYGTMHSMYPPQNKTADKTVPEWM
jgi:branched-chain amino acid transport system substrate-binding protein